MAKYSADAASALADIRDAGSVVTFTRAGGVIDPVTQQSVGEPISYAAPMVGFPLSAGKARYVFGEGADILKPRLSVIIALSGAAQTPRQGDRFVWGGKTYALLEPELLDPAGEGAAILAQGMAEAA